MSHSIVQYVRDKGNVHHAGESNQWRVAVHMVRVKGNGLIVRDQ